MLNVQPIVFSF